MNDPAYNTEFQKPLKDLRNRNPNSKWVEVLMIHKEVKGQYDPEWSEGTVIAKFLNSFSKEAYDFAVKLAKLEVIWVGGVMIR